MKENIIVILLILIIEISYEKYKKEISIKNNIPIILNSVILSTNFSDSVYNYTLYKKNYEQNDEYRNCEESKKVIYSYLTYEEISCINNVSNDSEILIVKNESIYNESFNVVEIKNSKINYNIEYILSLNNNLHSLIILDYINNTLIFENDTEIDNEDILTNENLCFNNSLNDENKDKKFICKLDYILFGHEDLKKDDVYLAKEVEEEHSMAILDNLLTFSIFPDDYLEYFFTSFFSELNDKCEKKEYKIEGYKNTIYYITCPKKKIELYTKRRKLSVIINKFSYRIIDLFQDSLDFLNKNENDENYYFNIVFEKDRKNFALGIGFFKNKKFGNYNDCTYIFSEERNNYTEDLTDINSDQFEIWLYILTTFSFTFLLLIFTIIGCIHSKKVNKELNEMLK